MKLGVFNLWTEMRDLPPSDAFEVSPLFFQDSARENAELPVAAPARRTTPAKKRKPVVIVDEITAS